MAAPVDHLAAPVERFGRTGRLYSRWNGSAAPVGYLAAPAEQFSRAGRLHSRWNGLATPVGYLAAAVERFGRTGRLSHRSEQHRKNYTADQALNCSCQNVSMQVQPAKAPCEGTRSRPSELPKRLRIMMAKSRTWSRPSAPRMCSFGIERQLRKKQKTAK